MPFQLLPEPPGALGIVRGVLYPVPPELGFLLQVPHVGNLLDLPLRPVLPQLGLAEELLHGLLLAVQQSLGQRLQAVSPSALVPPRVPQPRHVHGVAPQALRVDPFVEEDMPVEAVVVPHFLVALVLEPGLEDLQDVFPVCVAFDPERRVGAFAKVHVRPGENREADDLSVPHRALAAQVDLGHLRIARVKRLRMRLQHADHLLGLLHGAHDGHALERCVVEVHGLRARRHFGQSLGHIEVRGS
mmetsp:Transcript_887/g.3697  ORF Transcript_887/g.3697 Transcript_887/m.3697 type:complete len:244 (+) Transcript_887:1956-2687(+)